jgi:Permuted papain-like amidase enzyme, YaeF/YiiX, C92 family
MRSPLTVVAVFLASCAASCQSHSVPLHEGDIVFQSFSSSQTRAIQLATKSRFSHVGILLSHDGALMVYEAVGPVKFTPVDEWIDRDPGGHFVVKRLKNAGTVLTKGNIEKLERTAATFEGKPYDFVFNWSDEKMYCSELVWKIYNRALGIEIGSLRKLKDFDLSSPEVRVKLSERYPDGVPLEETVISPQDVFQSDTLATVYSQ